MLTLRCGLVRCKLEAAHGLNDHMFLLPGDFFEAKTIITGSRQEVSDSYFDAQTIAKSDCE